MSLYPFLRSPFTDLSGYMFNHQQEPHTLCAQFEMKFLDCLEANGLDKGRVVCSDLAMDLRECSFRDKQDQRVWRMQYERQRQYFQGEREKHYEEPPKLHTR